MIDGEASTEQSPTGHVAKQLPEMQVAKGRSTVRHVGSFHSNSVRRSQSNPKPRHGSQLLGKFRRRGERSGPTCVNWSLSQSPPNMAEAFGTTGYHEGEPTFETFLASISRDFLTSICLSFEAWKTARLNHETSESQSRQPRHARIRGSELSTKRTDRNERHLARIHTTTNQ